MTGPRWVVVAGFGRSGSTLLGMLLAEGGGFHCGELHLLWEALVGGATCQCGAPVAACEVWAAVAAEARAELGLRSDGEGAAIMEHRLRRRHLLAPRLPAPRPAELALRAATERATERVTGASLLVDTSKLSSVLWTAGHLDRPLTAVHLVRDPRAVAFSQSRPKPDPSRAGGALPRRPVVASAVDWWRGHLTTERVVRHLAGQGRLAGAWRVRYEDLVADPEAYVRRLVPPAARRWGAAVTGPAAPAVTGPQHAVAGNPVRFGRAPVRPDDRWRTEMAAGPRALCTVLTAPMIRRYGYPLWAPSSS
ncbi:MAG TPA: sulfotransferase [Acidimicrobiales bacterium]|nr:sulfotransferase [Acidimicrobiales bacterium]